MQIDVLSSAGGRSSGYLLRQGGAVVLVDCGPGTALGLARSGWLERLDAVVITHQHADHACDVIGLAFARRFPGPLPRIPLFAPASALSVIRRLDDLFAVPSLGEGAQTIAASFELGALSMDGVPAEIAGGLSLSSFAVAHPVPSAALRFDSGAQTVVFSSDTGACGSLIEAASDADLFLCEATYLEASAAELDRNGHLTPDLAAQAALAAGARRLVLTHLLRPEDAAAAVAAAGHHFEAAPVTAAIPGNTIGAGPA